MTGRHVDTTRPEDYPRSGMLTDPADIDPPKHLDYTRRGDASDYWTEVREDHEQARYRPY